MVLGCLGVETSFLSFEPEVLKIKSLKLAQEVKMAVSNKLKLAH